MKAKSLLKRFFQICKAALFVFLIQVFFFAGCSDFKNDNTHTGKDKKNQQREKTENKKETVLPASVNFPRNLNDTKTKLMGSVLSYKDVLMPPMPPAKRFATPFEVRWAMKFKNPVVKIDKTVLAGLLISSGPDVFNITSKAEVRFRHVAGKNHVAFALDDAQIIWSPKFQTLTRIKRRGLKDWTRKWNGQLVLNKGKAFLVDASNAAMMNSRGSDEWRVSADEMRSLTGPFCCGDEFVIFGRKGEKEKVFLIGKDGSVSQKINLPRVSYPLGVDNECKPLIWRNKVLMLLNRNGTARWKKEFLYMPIVKRAGVGLIVIASEVGQPVNISIISDSGKIVFSTDMPFEGKVMSATAKTSSRRNLPFLGLCVGVASSCSQKDANAGSFNTLVIPSLEGRFSTLIRLPSGHLDFDVYDDGSYLVVSSSTPHTTTLTMRNSTDKIMRQINLPGRLSAGPLIKRDGEIYIATCKGLSCLNPYLLISVTGL